MNQALEQFRILNFKVLTFNISNVFLISLVILSFLLTIFYILNKKNNLLFSKGFMQLLIKQTYLFVLDVLLQNVGLASIIYFPMLFTVFFFIFIVNFSGLVGYNLQLTSHIFITLSLAMGMFISIIIIGIKTLKIKFLNQFIPKDAPKALFPLLVLIEIISYVIRPFTLGIRLFANMFSGHVLLFVIINFIIMGLENKFIFIKILIVIFPIILLFVIMSLELLIAFLQAYVFIMLLAVYLNDSLHSH
jgi:ATP synthase subunit 6